MPLDPEACLWIAVRDALRTGMRLSPQECDIEIDEHVPPVVGHRYLMVMPGSAVPGKYESTTGSTTHRIYTVRVGILLRVTSVAYDRTREVLHVVPKSISELTGAVIGAVAKNEALRNAANSLIEGLPECNGFKTALRFAGQDAPREVSGEYFRASREEERAGFLRVVTFGGAEYLRNL